MVIKEWRLGQHFFKILESCTTHLHPRIALYFAVATKDNFWSQHAQLILNLPGFDPAGSTLKL